MGDRIRMRILEIFKGDQKGYIWQLTLILSLVLSGCNLEEKNETRIESTAPNVVLIFTDDLDFEEIGTYAPANSMKVAELRKVKEPVPEPVINDLKVRYGIYTRYIRENYGFDYVDGLYIQNTNQTGIPDVWGRPEGNMQWMTYHAVADLPHDFSEFK